MATIPTRHSRTSLLDRLGMDFGQYTPAQRIVATEQRQQELLDMLQEKAHKAGKFTLEDIMANERFKKMFDDIANIRVGVARDSNLDKLGYAYDPQTGSWNGALWEDVQEGGDLAGAPWYRTAREAINAIYNDALRGDHGEHLADFDIDDLYAQMNRLVDERAQEALSTAQDPEALRAQLVKGNIYDDEGKVVPFEDHGKLYGLASMLLPMRTIGAAMDPELSARSTWDQNLRNGLLDAGELLITGLNPIGKLAGKAATAAMKYAGKAAVKMPSLVGRGLEGAAESLGRTVEKPWVKLAGEGSIGNLGNYYALHGADYAFDPENQSQSGAPDKTGAIIAALAGGAPGLVGGFLDKIGKGAAFGAASLMSPKDKARTLIGEALDINPSEVDDRLVQELLAKNATWEDYLKAPFRDISNEGYPYAGIAQVPRQFQKGGMLHGDRQMMLDDLKDVFPESRHGAIKEWMDMNPKEVQDLAGGSSYSRYNRDDAGVPGTTPESWDVFGVTADQSPQFYKSKFKVPLKSESETIEGLAKDEIEKRMQRGDKLSKDYATRRQIHDKGTGSANVDWKAKVWAPDVKSFVKDKQSLNPGSAGLRRFGLWGTRLLGVGDPQEGLPNFLIGERDPIYEQVRTRGVPTKNKENK